MKKEIFYNGQAGNTPLNATNLNKMQDNMEESAVVVSATQPTTNEKVWIKTSKNIYDKSKSINGIALNTQNGDTYANAQRATSDFVEVNANTEYTLSTAGVATGYNVCEYDANKNFLSGGIKSTFTTSNTTRYVRFYSGISEMQSIKLEEGGTATEYEEYADQTLLVKNKEDKFEEFINKGKVMLNEYVRSNIGYGGNLHFHKMGKLVFVNGLYSVNATQVEFEVPYKPNMSVSFPCTARDTSNNPVTAVGNGVINTEGLCTLKFTSAVTFAYMSFVYATD